jgi:hypothetical protein
MSHDMTETFDTSVPQCDERLLVHPDILRELDERLFGPPADDDEPERQCVRMPTLEHYIDYDVVHRKRPSSFPK